MVNKLFSGSRLYLWIVIASLSIGACGLPFIISNINKLSYSFISGKITKSSPLLYMVYIVGKRLDQGFEDITFAEDFSSVYEIAKHLDKPDIYTGKYDFIGRTTPYPPILFYLYKKIFSDMPFAQAALSYIFLQVLILIISSYWVLRYYRLGIMIIPVSVLYFFILFLTPVGLGWFERGQFDIYSGVAILFLMFAIYESKSYAFVLSAFFASLKFSAILFILQAFVIYLIFFRNPKALKSFILFVSVVLLTFIFFPVSLIKSYLVCCIEFNNASHFVDGISLQRIMPFWSIKYVPILGLSCYFLILFLKKKEPVFFKTFVSVRPIHLEKILI